MVTKATLEIKGLAEYMETLQQAGKDIDAAADRALTAGADILLAGMMDLVPVDSGHLLQTLAIKGPTRKGGGNYHFVEIGIIHELGYTDKETAIYANVMEYGSPSKNIAPHSYIRAAIDSKRALAMRAIRESLKAEGLAD